jgi:membrane protein DedA with SNARE-associated domain
MPFLLANVDDRVIRWVSNGGYPVLFGLLFGCGLGLPLPEDIPLLAAGLMIFLGKFNPMLAAICAWCGIIGGDCVLYHLGKRFGLEVTKVPVIGSHLTLSRILEVEKHFKRWGVWVVAVGRLFAGVRGVMVVCAGAIRFPFWKFLIADGLAAVVSGGTFLFLGYYFGTRMDVLRQHVQEGKKWALLALLAVALAIGVWIWVHNRLAGRKSGAAAQPPGASPSDTSGAPT